jgi:hypothetical protein
MNQDATDGDRQWLRAVLDLVRPPWQTPTKHDRTAVGTGAVARGGAIAMPQPLTHDRIAVAAYYIWKNEGCPEGRADEHWHLAVEWLKYVDELLEGTRLPRGPRR